MGVLVFVLNLSHSVSTLGSCFPLSLKILLHIFFLQLIIRELFQFLPISSLCVLLLSLNLNPLLGSLLDLFQQCSLSLLVTNSLNCHVVIRNDFLEVLLSMTMRIWISILALLYLPSPLDRLTPPRF